MEIPQVSERAIYSISGLRCPTAEWWTAWSTTATTPEVCLAIGARDDGPAAHLQPQPWGPRFRPVRIGIREEQAE